MKKNLIPLTALAFVTLSLASCQGAVTDWTAATAFGDGKLEYSLLIGQIDHNDSAARTAGIRDALKTRGEKSSNPNQESPVDGKLTINGTEYTTHELDHQEARTTAGATWDAGMATSITENWINKFGNSLDFIVSNNDGMAEGALNANNIIKDIPIFGYDSNDSTLKLIKEGKISGTINQNAPAQVATMFMTLRNLLDKADINDGITKESANGYGKIENTVNYHDDSHAFLVDNFAITKDGITGTRKVDDYVGKQPSEILDKGVKKGTTEKRKVLIALYSEGDTFLNSTVVPLFEASKDLFNFEITIVKGDGSDDAKLIDQIKSSVDSKKYDAYLVNPITTTSYKGYLDVLPADKPVVFFNRQATKADGTVDTEIMENTKFNGGKGLYYVGFDAIQGGQLQGEMIVNYLTEVEKTK